MKKMNKKGFTLAELLIVIAIIAILIAIAIPAFGGALDNAKMQTDHANMRSAVAFAQVANMQNELYLDDSATPTTLDKSKTYNFTPAGSISETAAACTLKSEKHSSTNTACANSATCGHLTGTVTTTSTITLQYSTANSRWEVVIA